MMSVNIFDIFDKVYKQRIVFMPSEYAFRLRNIAGNLSETISLRCDNSPENSVPKRYG
jgi:hypothetical protein